MKVCLCVRVRGAGGGSSLRYKDGLTINTCTCVRVIATEPHERQKLYPIVKVSAGRLGAR